jgi:transposase-like protein
MVSQVKKFYSEEFQERVLAAYRNSNESVTMIAERFGINRNTFHSWVYHKKQSPDCEKKGKLAKINSTTMENEEMSVEAMLARIRELEHHLSLEKIRSESLSKMIEITERELKIDIRKKTGAKQSLR